MENNDEEEGSLADEVSGEVAFEIEMRLLDGFEMGEEGHTQQARDIPFEHGYEFGAGVQQLADPGGAKKDQDNEDDIDKEVDKKGGRGDSRLFGAFEIRANEPDMGVLEQSAFRGFEDGDGGKEDGPCAVS